MKPTPKIREMADSLLSRYDAISKVDAVRFLKDLYPKMYLIDFMNAYRLAYE
jgi:hypothetical protein